MASRRTGDTKGIITTPIALYYCFCWFAGGSHHDICLTTAFYCYTHRCIAATLVGNECDALGYKFPSTPMEVECAAQDFKSMSLNGFMEGCVAAMDGLLIKTIVPARSEVGNVRAFFSGHYHHCGLKGWGWPSRNIETAREHFTVASKKNQFLYCIHKTITKYFLKKTLFCLGSFTKSKEPRKRTKKECSLFS